MALRNGGRKSLLKQIVNNMNSDILYYRFTGQCNENCSFCYREYKDYGDSTELVKVNLVLAKKIGFKVIGFLGGEVTTREDLLEILQFSKSLGLTNYLITNGFKLIEKFNELKNYVDYIGLPLDGFDYDTEFSIRNNHQFTRTIECIEWIQKHSNIPFRLSTMVNSKNYSYLDKIEDYVYNTLNFRPDTWRLLPYLNLNNKQSDLSLTDNMQEEVINFVKNSRHKISISNSKYYILSKNSELYLSDNDKFNLLGKFENIQNINELNNSSWIIDALE